MSDSIDRRDFLKKSTAAGLGLTAAPHLASATGRSAQNTVVVAVMGVNNRGNALAESFAGLEGVEVGYVADPDMRAVDETVSDVEEIQGSRPEGMEDFRNALEDDGLDALVIGATDHWHAPASIMAMKADKHVYVEKPCGHNPREGELLVEAQQKYNRVVQMGTQQRSDPRTIELVQRIREGVIGDPYYGKAWYSNDRGSIGYGKPAEVPSWLNYELWQGPAPRTPYRNNVVHYNWHWFWRWGTGESCNNGTHEVDVCRWALDVDFPTEATSTAGRYHYNDDWEFYDTQVMTFEFGDEATITWEGRSCNPLPHYDRGRGASIHGSEGSAVVDRNGYILYDMDNNEIERNVEGDGGSGLDTTAGGSMTDRHARNFIEAIRDGSKLNQPIDSGHKSVLLCHLGNITEYVGDAVHLDPSNGRIVGNRKAEEMWSRDYEPGWEPTV